MIHVDKEDLRRLLGYLAQAAECIAKAHAAGIVHRDLKPNNIMVSKDGFAMVLASASAAVCRRSSRTRISVVEVESGRQETIESKP